MVLCYVPDRRSEEIAGAFQRTAAKLARRSGACRHLGAPPQCAVYSRRATTLWWTRPWRSANSTSWHFRPQGVRSASWCTANRWTIRKLTRMLTNRRVRIALMGGPPFSEYMFIYHVGRDFGGGGMEHINCTAISAASPAALLNVSAHEFFHLWNVKRIRPQSLEPVDYTREMWTPSLWFAEGVTNTYASYTLVRTGLWTKAQFLADLGDQITELESRPAHRWQSAEESSLDAWLEKYPLYNSPAFSVSYYNKGQLLGVALDISIRDATDNRASLDDVLRRLNRDYAQRGRFYPESAGIQKAVEECRARSKAGCQVRRGRFLQTLHRRHERLALRRLALARGLGAQDERAATRYAWIRSLARRFRCGAGLRR